jgi:hypothetical protein
MPLSPLAPAAANGRTPGLVADEAEAVLDRLAGNLRDRHAWPGGRAAFPLEGGRQIRIPPVPSKHVTA